MVDEIRIHHPPCIGEAQELVRGRNERNEKEECDRLENPDDFSVFGLDFALGLRGVLTGGFIVGFGRASGVAAISDHS